MNIGWKQVAASVSGALIAALALSFLGAGGTILGVALGSAAATLGSAVAFQSLERGHATVRKIVDSVASPGTAPGPVPTPEPTIALPPQGAADHGVRPASPAPPPLHGRGSTSARRWSVPVVIIVVFFISIGIVTGVELLVGRPLSSVVSGTPSARHTSVGDLLKGGTTTSTTSTSSTTTSTSTEVPVPPVKPTTTTAPGTSTTTTLPASTTTSSTSTTVPSTTTSQP